MIMALTIAVLVTGAVFLVLQRGLVRIIFGMSLFGHASNLTLLASGVGAWRGEAFPGRGDVAEFSDPLPQAFVLTAIVIAMATTTLLLMMAALGNDDDTRDTWKEAPSEVPDTRGPDGFHSGDPFSTLGRASRRVRAAGKGVN